MEVRVRRLLGLVAAVALGCAGCGADEEGSAEATGAPVGEDLSSYIAAADEICREADEEAVEQIGKRFAGLTPENAKPKQLRRIAEEILVPVLKKQLRELRALPMPEDDAEELSAIYAKVQAGIREVLDDPKLVISGTTPSLREASDLAGDYGFQTCGR